MPDVTSNNSTQIDWSNLAGSAVSAGSGLLGSLIAGAYNRKRQRESQAWAEKMWNAQNQYNLPINQVVRLKEAGINPNLAFGSSASAMGTNVPSTPHYSESPDFGAPIQRGISEYFQRRFEKKQLLTQLDWQNEQIRKLKMDNDTTSLLLDDYRAMKRSEYALGKLKNSVDQTLYGRQRNLEVDLLSANWLNAIDKYLAHVPAALANHYRAQDALLRTKNLTEFENYLTTRSKGRFERGYYDRGLNPYETSTVAGLIRTIMGLGDDYSSDPGKYDNPIFDFDDSLNRSGRRVNRYFGRIMQRALNAVYNSVNSRRGHRSFRW